MFLFLTDISRFLCCFPRLWCSYRCSTAPGVALTSPPLLAQTKIKAKPGTGKQHNTETYIPYDTKNNAEKPFPHLHSPKGSTSTGHSGVLLNTSICPTCGHVTAREPCFMLVTGMGMSYYRLHKYPLTLMGYSFFKQNVCGGLYSQSLQELQHNRYLFSVPSAFTRKEDRIYSP